MGDKPKGLDGQSPLGPVFQAQANGGNPITPQKLLAKPLSQWDAVIKENGPPANPKEFEGNLRRQVTQPLQLGVFNISHQIDLMRRGLQPTDPSGGNPVVQNLYKAAIEAAKDNPDFGKSDVQAMADKIKEQYSSKITQIMEGYKPAPPPAPAPAAPAPAAPTAPTDQQPTAPAAPPAGGRQQTWPSPSQA